MTHHCIKLKVIQYDFYSWLYFPVFFKWLKVNFSYSLKVLHGMGEVKQKIFSSFSIIHRELKEKLVSMNIYWNVYLLLALFIKAQLNNVCITIICNRIKLVILVFIFFLYSINVTFHIIELHDSYILAIERISLKLFMLLYAMLLVHVIQNWNSFEINKKSR